MTTSNATVITTAKTLTKTEQRAIEIQSLLVTNLEARLDAHEAKSGKVCSTLRTDIAKFKSENGFLTIVACLKKGIKLDDFISTVVKHDDEYTDAYLAVKAITKCRQFMQAIAQNNYRLIDGYTDSIVRNLIKHQSLTVFECLQCLSTKVINENTDFMRIDERKKIEAFKNSSASTATTQASSTRMMLKLFNICTVQKGKKDDIISFTDAKTAKLMLDLYKINDQESNAETV